jgi:hypothetical protein
VSAEEMDYQKKLKWLKDLGKLIEDEVKYPEEQSSGNEREQSGLQKLVNLVLTENII